MCETRIKIRGRKGEENMNRGYLSLLHEEYKDHMTQLRRKGIKVVTIDGTASKDVCAKRAADILVRELMTRCGIHLDYGIPEVGWTIKAGRKLNNLKSKFKSWAEEVEYEKLEEEK